MQSGITAQLHTAQKHLDQGNYDRAFSELEKALHSSPDPAERQTIQRLQAEARLGNALAEESKPLRLRQIDAALKIMPDSPRLRFYRGLTLWETNEPAQARVEFEAVAVKQPDWPRVAYLVQLMHLAEGDSWQTDGLDQREINTLHLVQALINAPQNQQVALPSDSLIGDTPAVWQMLTDMNQAKATPAITLDETFSDKIMGDIIHYYQGVAALRSNDMATASLAFAEMSATTRARPWVRANLSALLRVQVTDLAEQERWQNILDITADAADLLHEDRILAETVALAHNHIGYESAQAQLWRQAAAHWQQANAYAGSRQLAQNLALAAEAVEAWEQAAAAWRDMIRRRPRTKTHPDYLETEQVAALWLHAAGCYKNADDIDEAIVCLKNASKYAGDDVDTRLELVFTLMYNDQFEAAYNELQRLLSIAPNNIDVLKQLAVLYMQSSGRWEDEAIATWKQILLLAPEDADAQSGLAEAYVEKSKYLWFKTPQKEIEFLLKALEDVPAHPALSLLLSITYRNTNQTDKAVATLLKVVEERPREVGAVAMVLHEMLHIETDDSVVEELIVHAREMPRSLPGFWLAQIEQLLLCDLDKRWVERFVGEAIALTEQPYVQETRVSVLVTICELFDMSGNPDLARSYLDRLRAEAPQSGAVEYITAMSSLGENLTYLQTRRLLKTARRLAMRAAEQVLQTRIEEALEEIETGPEDLPPGLLQELIKRFPHGAPSPEALEAVFDDYFDE